MRGGSRSTDKLREKGNESLFEPTRSVFQSAFCEVSLPYSPKDMLLYLHVFSLLLYFSKFYVYFGFALLRISIATPSFNSTYTGFETAVLLSVRVSPNSTLFPLRG